MKSGFPCRVHKCPSLTRLRQVDNKLLWADVPGNWAREDIDLEVPDDVETQAGLPCPSKNPFGMYFEDHLCPRVVVIAFCCKTIGCVLWANLHAICAQLLHLVHFLCRSEFILLNISIWLTAFFWISLPIFFLLHRYLKVLFYLVVEWT